MLYELGTAKRQVVHVDVLGGVGSDYNKIALKLRLLGYTISTNF